MKRALFWWVGLSMVTSRGLAGRLQWRAISPVMKALRSAPRWCRLDRASLKVCSSDSTPRDSGGETPGGGEILRGRGESLKGGGLEW